MEAGNGGGWVGGGGFTEKDLLYHKYYQTIPTLDELMLRATHASTAGAFHTKCGQVLETSD
jgi:hypothetical protein